MISRRSAFVSIPWHSFAYAFESDRHVLAIQALSCPKVLRIVPMP